MTQPYYQDEYVTLYHGDCREVLPLVEPADCILTDPPYSSGGFQESGRSGGSVGTRQGAVVAYDNLSTRGYERLLREVLRHVNQADEVFMFTDWRMWIHTFDGLESAGWRVRNMLVWDKMVMGMGMPWRNQHELIAYGKRSPGRILEGKSGNVLRCRRAERGDHPTSKPVGLLSTLLANSDARSVIDPFAGAGSTLLAARALERKATGVEIDEAYCEVAAKRLAQEVMHFEVSA